MNRGNMGKQIATAPKSKKVKKMMFGGPVTPMLGGPVTPMLGGPTGGPVTPMLGGPTGGPVTPMLGGPTVGPVTPMLGGPRGDMRAMRDAQRMQRRSDRDAHKMERAGMTPATMQRAMPMKKGGAVKKMAEGGMARGDGCCMKGKTKGKMC